MYQLLYLVMYSSIIENPMKLMKEGKTLPMSIPIMLITAWEKELLGSVWCSSAILILSKLCSPSHTLLSSTQISQVAFCRAKFAASPPFTDSLLATWFPLERQQWSVLGHPRLPIDCHIFLHIVYSLASSNKMGQWNIK